MKKLLIAAAAAFMLMPTVYGSDTDIARINEAGEYDISYSRSSDVPDVGSKHTGVSSRHTGVSSRHTIIIFMIGSDMARYGEYDICEMLNSGYSDKDTNVILITGGSEDWSINSLKDGVKAYRLCGDAFKRLDGRTDYNIFDTDDIYTIMFKYMNEFRADKYSVFFWDHGGGYVNGFGYDETGRNPSIMPSDLADVFYDIRNDVKRDFGLDYSFDTVGFDACFMADIQTAAEFARAGFEYYIGSADMESCYGWDYSFLGDLKSDSRYLAQSIIDKTVAYSKSRGKDMSLSCIKLSEIGNVVSEINNIAQEIVHDNYLLQSISARSDSYDYGGGLSSDERITGGVRDYVDISDYAKKLNKSGIDTTALLESVNNAVVYCADTQAMSCGLSVYSYGGGTSASLDRWIGITEGMDEYENLQKLSYERISAASAVGADISGNDVVSDTNTYSYTMTDTEASIMAKAWFSVYEKTDSGYRRRFITDEVNTDNNVLSVTYDGETAQLVNGKTVYPCTLDKSDGEYSVRIKKDMGKGAYAADFRDITLGLDGSVKYTSSSGLSAKDDADISVGDMIYAHTPVVDYDNSELGYVPDIFTVHDMKPEITQAVGTLYCRFEIINAYGFVQYYSPLKNIMDVRMDTVSGKSPKISSYRSVNGINLPCSADGFEFVSTPRSLVSGEQCYATVRVSNKYIDVIIKNFSLDTRLSDNCTVIAAFSDSGELFGMSAGDYINGSDADCVYKSESRDKYIYSLGGVLPDFDNGDLSLNGLYNNFPHGYAVFETDKSGRITRLGLSSQSGIDITYSVVDCFDIQYVRPNRLGYAPYSFTFSLCDDLYRLPVPVSELTENGWSGLEDIVIPSGGACRAELVRNGMSITAELVNYSDFAAKSADCVVCGIYAVLTDSNSPTLMLSGGINLNAAANGDFNHVLSRASEFAMSDKSLVYASGAYLDYDGEISIYNGSVYMYKRYKNLRSMSDFDHIAKYYVF